MPVIPQANTAHFEDLLPPPLTSQEFWLDGTLELMMRCDAVVMVPGWQYSTGSIGERKCAKEIALPVWDDIAHVPEASKYQPLTSIPRAEALLQAPLPQTPQDLANYKALILQILKEIDASTTTPTPAPTPDGPSDSVASPDTSASPAVVPESTPSMAPADHPTPLSGDSGHYASGV